MKKTTTKKRGAKPAARKPRAPKPRATPAPGRIFQPADAKATRPDVRLRWRPAIREKGTGEVYEALPREENHEQIARRENVRDYEAGWMVDG